MNERKHGIISRWHDEKGFGFIKNTQTHDELFFHISDYRPNKRPNVGEQVYFILTKDKKGRPCASEIQEKQFVDEKISEKNQRLRKKQHINNVKMKNKAY